ncbi:hypothetical protein GHK01_31770 [Sinorhizobium meliloti]|uniref:hypothetical protein n=1 Tax=Rhizobium meliloti TaxID=382 RepID=UPI001295E62D|nr:hypothetical protein [Sinorhizobium meliloti]MQV31040.1 hypothetical protein [Sinorhizobium meliloti]
MIDDTPPHLKEGFEELGVIVDSYLRVLMLIGFSTRRDPAFTGTHLLLPLFQDLVESATAVRYLCREGMKSAAKRELRFLVEASIKMCFVQQQSYHTTHHEKLNEFEKVLTSPRVSLRDIDLYFLSDQSKTNFIEEAGRLYGKTSSFVHWTGHQIQRRILEINEGRTVGKETVDDVKENNVLVRQALAISLVTICHAVPPSAIGDLFVGEDGSTLESYYFGSRFMAEIDQYFDYKHERQAQLEQIKGKRTRRIQF